MTIKSTLICATAITLALTSFDLRPAAAAPQGGPAIAQQAGGDTDFSAARKRRRAYPGAPLAAFGAIAGTIAGIAAANARRGYYEQQYYAPGYYGGPAYVAPPAYQYYEPQYYEAPVYQRRYGTPAYQGRDYYSRWGGSGGQPGYHGPNVNVPGPTNYGNAAGQNGQAPPTGSTAAQGGSN